MRKISMGKRGQAMLDATTKTVIGVMIFLFVVFAVLFGIATLSPSSFFTAGSLEANNTAKIQANLTQGIGTFSDQIPTAFKVIGVVFILGFIALLIVVVSRMRSVGGGSAGGL